MIRLDAADCRNMLAGMSQNKNEISTVSEFLKRVKEIRADWWSKDKDDPWMPWFRGHQHADWKLQPRLYRDYDSKRRKKSRIEDEIREEFAVRAPALSNLRPTNQWDWYFLMQHSGAPTRLLDWSEGALIGLYFAVKDNPGFNDAAVWVLDPYRLNERIVGEQELICPTVAMNPKDQKTLKRWLPEPFAKKRKKLPSEPVPILPAHAAQRISSQRSCFTIHGSDQDGMDKLQGNDLLIKITIPASYVVKIRRELEIYGIDEVTIFPDLDGLGRCVSARWKSDRHNPPHEGVCTRIEPSKIDTGGVGIFAVMNIKKGAPLFQKDNGEMLWVDETAIKSACRTNPAIRLLYRDFPVYKKGGNGKNGKFGCPVNFNRLTASWYINEPKRGGRPNVRCDENYDFYALENINAGEELTVDYSKYSDSLPVWLTK